MPRGVYDRSKLKKAVAAPKTESATLKKAFEPKVKRKYTKHAETKNPPVDAGFSDSSFQEMVNTLKALPEKMEIAAYQQDTRPGWRPHLHLEVLGSLANTASILGYQASPDITPKALLSLINKISTDLEENFDEYKTQLAAWTERNTPKVASKSEVKVEEKVEIKAEVVPVPVAPEPVKTANGQTVLPAPVAFIKSEELSDTASA